MIKGESTINVVHTYQNLQWPCEGYKSCLVAGALKLVSKPVITFLLYTCLPSEGGDMFRGTIGFLYEPTSISPFMAFSIVKCTSSSY